MRDLWYWLLFKLFYCDACKFENKGNVKLTYKRHIPWYPQEQFCKSCIKEIAGGYRLEWRGKEVALWTEQSLKHGVISADIRVNGPDGFLPAFWLFGENGMPEYDFEWFGDDQHLAVCTHWGYDYEPTGKQWPYKTKKNTHHGSRIHPHFNTGEWNNYSFELTPYEVVFCVNGFVVQRMKKAVSTNQQHLIISINKGMYKGEKGVMEIRNIKFNRVS